MSKKRGTRGPKSMIGRPERIIEQPAEYSQPVAVQYGDDESPPDELLEEVLTRLEGSSEAFCIVSKIVMHNGQRREQWLFECSPTPNIESEIQSAYDAGDYRIRIYQRRVAADGVRRPLLVKNTIISIGPSRDPKPTAAPVTMTQQGAIIPQQSDRIGELLAEMQRSNERVFSLMNTIVQGVIGNAGAKGQNTLGEFKSFAESLGFLRDASPKIDPLDMVAKIADLAKQFVPDKPAGVDPETGDVGPNALMIEAIKTFAGIFAAVKNGSPAATLNGLPAIVAPAPGEPVPVPVPSFVAERRTPIQEDEDTMMLRLFLKKLCKAAAKTEAVEGYAEQIDALADDSAVTMIQSPQWWEMLVGFAPEVAPYKDWFARLREALLPLLADGEVKAEPDGNVSGDSAGVHAPGT